MTTESPAIGVDQPLKFGTALSNDKLSRTAFAQSAAATLKNVTSSNGFVLSIEGAWGSGKTSTLAMIEELLPQGTTSNRPVVVHFNPWLIGDRDALLRQFLVKPANAVSLPDHAKDGKKVAKEIKAYAKAFDVIKLIPGAEPWASIVKSVFAAVGDTAGSVAEHKTKDIEQHKSNVEAVLRNFPKPIVVFIDDIDRLFPLEVFEMVRIVKAVGELPNVGYVLSWDPSYVVTALRGAGVPQAESYLEKIVQVRMPLPSLSMSAKERLINDALASLDPAAIHTHFPKDGERLSSLYYSGLRELFEQPRDVTRVFNTVALIEPALRGEIVFSDIVGLAALMVKAPPMFELLKKSPKFFVGRMPGNQSILEKSEDLLKAGSEARKEALARCATPGATRKVVHYLFPLSAKADDVFALNRVVEVEGHIAHPARLLVALQLSVSPTDVSFVLARRFVVHPEQRTEIAQGLTREAAFEFMEAIGDLAGSLGGDAVTDLEVLCLTIAELADSGTFSARAKDRSGGFGDRAEDIAVRAIEEIVKAVDRAAGPDLARKIVGGGRALSLSAELIATAYLERDRKHETLPCPQEAAQKAQLLARHAEHVLARVTAGTFFETSNPACILWVHGQVVPAACNELFDAIRVVDPTLDDFALAFLSHSFDSTKGQTYLLQQEQAVLEAFCSLTDFREHARKRLEDPGLDYPVKAAWRSVVEGKKLYAVDGSEARH